MDKQNQGKFAIVTGPSTGIGRELALAGALLFSGAVWFWSA